MNLWQQFEKSNCKKTNQGISFHYEKGIDRELREFYLILSSHKKIEKCSEQKLRQTRRRTQAGLTPGKDDNEVWHIFCRNRLKVSMGA